MLIVLRWLGIFILFYFILLFFSEKNPVYRDRTHVPACQNGIELTSQRVGTGSNSRPNASEGYEVTSELPGRPVACARKNKRYIQYNPIPGKGIVVRCQIKSTASRGPIPFHSRLCPV